MINSFMSLRNTDVRLLGEAYEKVIQKASGVLNEDIHHVEDKVKELELKIESQKNK